MSNKSEEAKVKTPLICFFEKLFPKFIYISPGQWLKCIFTIPTKMLLKKNEENDVLKKHLRTLELSIVELWVGLKFIIFLIFIFHMPPSFFREHHNWSVGIAIWAMAESVFATIILVAIKPTQGDDPDDKIESPIRTIFLVFINYIHITLMYAVLFICSTDQFKTSFDAFYFSTISITTLGYRDLKCDFGARLLVICELYTGLIMIVLAISVLVSKLSAIVRATKPNEDQ